MQCLRDSSNRDARMAFPYVQIVQMCVNKGYLFLTDKLFLFSCFVKFIGPVKI